MLFARLNQLVGLLVQQLQVKANHEALTNFMPCFAVRYFSLGYCLSFSKDYPMVSYIL